MGVDLHGRGLPLAQLGLRAQPGPHSDHHPEMICPSSTLRPP
eukprot:CAMPEP_0169462542 /NCGR_PEP_ID=MMETSP1042-20121227/19624_1 /TAXON_ID=464988 /ORGANISM="Hemiselmis andersenii, Strain CCMP1180" /LENGTH=41 /DNA_ID= /DNA_START= /DNA_END= /DNA_ORIENTATION=